MTGDGCDEMRLLLQADVDGELQPADSARVSAHLEQCPSCAVVQTDLIALSDRLRRTAPRYAASDRLRAAVHASIQSAQPATTPARARNKPFFATVTSFGGGFALAACLALFLLLPRSGSLPDSVVAAHIRALQPGHLTDVISTDQHTVKPWFDGKLPFAPPVKNLAAQGYPLIGGRMDYLGGQTAAALVYQGGKHLIDLFAWPTAESIDRDPSTGARDGYNFVRWRQDGMAFWAVSDLAPDELSAFVKKWQEQ
jgi:anti-sigma factor RsiW